jgi:hypothetical protein
VREDAIGRIDAFTILTTDGKRLRIHLLPGLDYGFGAVGLAHLEEHSISGEPIRAAVRRRDGKLIALTVDDA